MGEVVLQKAEEEVLRDPHFIHLADHHLQEPVDREEEGSDAEHQQVREWV